MTEQQGFANIPGITVLKWGMRVRHAKMKDDSWATVVRIDTDGVGYTDRGWVIVKPLSLYEVELASVRPAVPLPGYRGEEVKGVATTIAGKHIYTVIAGGRSITIQADGYLLQSEGTELRFWVGDPAQPEYVAMFKRTGEGAITGFYYAGPAPEAEKGTHHEPT